jgi:hypothetical protein
MNWKNRIVGHGTEDPSQLVSNPFNWRVHPTHQRHAVKDALDQVGWIQEAVINRTTGNVVDGHLRIDLAVEQGETEIPVQYVELTEKEEKLVLATLDPLSALAVADQDQLKLLMEDIDAHGAVLKGFLDDLEQAVGPPPEMPLRQPDPSDFWPRITFRLPPNVYSEWRDKFEALPGDEDHQKVARLLEAVEGPPQLATVHSIMEDDE